MATAPELLDWTQELLAPLGPVRSRRMFGGWGLYLDGLFMALIAQDQLYLKVDDLSRAEFEAAGCLPFRYPRSDGGVAQLNYYTVPAEALDSADQMQPWARQALASALRAQASKAAAAPRAKRATRKRQADGAASKRKRAA